MKGCKSSRLSAKSLYYCNLRGKGSFANVFIFFLILTPNQFPVSVFLTVLKVRTIGWPKVILLIDVLQVLDDKY